MNLDKLKAKRVKVMEYSALSELLRVTAKPEIISLAGGLPAPESFPLKVIKELNDLILKTRKFIFAIRSNQWSKNFEGRDCQMVERTPHEDIS